MTGVCLADLPPVVRVSFSEGAVAGTKKLLDVNLERDLGADGGGAVSARITRRDDGGGSFALEVTRSSRDRRRISFLHLVTAQSLDRERKARYSLSVELELEGGGRRGFELRVEVLDINDNPPVFEEDRYTARTNRSAPPGTELLRVRAADADDGKNARLTYHLGQPEEFASHFDVTRDTGVLSTRAALNCGNEDEDCPKCLLPSSGEPCSLLVYARDGGRPQQSSYAVVRVTLVEGNDHDPSLSLRHLPDQTRPYSVLSRGAPAGSSVAAVTVSDPDPGRHGQLASLEIVSGNEAGTFELERFGGGGGRGNLYLVRLASAARLRRDGNFKLRLVAKDAGSPARTGEAVLEIRIEEKNEFRCVLLHSHTWARGGGNGGECSSPNVQKPIPSPTAKNQG